MTCRICLRAIEFLSVTENSGRRVYLTQCRCGWALRYADGRRIGGKS
jgi:hypothetical protein